MEQEFSQFESLGRFTSRQDLHSFFSNMDKKLAYRIKIAFYFIGLGILTFSILYLTVPNIKKGPTIRVLYISYNGPTMVTTEIPRINKTVIVDRNQLKLSATSQPFYKNNVVLECISEQTPVTWMYDGFGMPSITVENTRRFLNFNDTTTYTFQSSLNMMPISEMSSGGYSCLGVMDPSESDSIQLYVPGGAVFILQKDIIVESDLRDHLVIPCLVSDPNSNVSLISKGNVIDQKFITSFSPEKGFILNAKFLEEGEPLSTFFCRDETTKQKSGKITVTLKKDSLVQVTPRNESVSFSDFNGTFICNTKENATLKFRRIRKYRNIQYLSSLSSDFPFTTFVSFEEGDLRDGSVISCVTLAQGSFLHNWTVSLSKQPKQEMQSMSFSYEENADEYICCGSPGSRPQLRKLSCNHPIECLIQQNCLDGGDTGQNCRVENLRLIEKSSCLRYKVDYEDDISTGLLKCESGLGNGKGDFLNYINMRVQNDTILQGSIFSNTDFSDLMTPENLSKFLIGVENVFTRATDGGTLQKYRCKAPKSFFSAGFIWQIVRYNGLLEYFDGIDHFDGAWVHSEVQFEDRFTDFRQAKKVYCIAPVWNSNTKFALKYSYISTLS